MVTPQRTRGRCLLSIAGSAQQVMFYPRYIAQNTLIFKVLRGSTNQASITCVALPE